MNDLKDPSEKESELRKELRQLLIESNVPEDLINEYLQLYDSYAQLSLELENIPPLTIDTTLPPEPSEETLQMYSDGHEQYYKNQIEDIASDDSWSLLVMRSGMYGGKSSCLFDLVDQLQKKGQNTTLYISSAMGEPYITGRRFKQDNKRREAKKFGGFADNEIYGKIFAEIYLSKTPFIAVDEYTFSNPEEINTLINIAKAHRKRLILLGLDTNYLGDELPIFKSTFFQKELARPTTRILECFSYVNTPDTSKPPHGRGTIRYLNMGNRWLLDLGLGQLVISKEHGNLVHYYPSIETLKHILADYPFFEVILNGSVNPNSAIALSQKNITTVLSQRSLRKDS